MEQATVVSASLLPVSVNGSQVRWGIAGGGAEAQAQLETLLAHGLPLKITVVAPAIDEGIRTLAGDREGIDLIERPLTGIDLSAIDLLIVATGNPLLDESVSEGARRQRCLVYTGAADRSDFVPALPAGGKRGQEARGRYRLTLNSEQGWRRLTSRFILVFFLMVIGHIIISYLPLPSFGSVWEGVRPYFNRQFLFFVVSGFLAQMVDGTLGMGYGVTSATCLMSFGIAPVSVSAAIHTSEIFTTATSGYSHYKFGNVNKKMFRHLVIPGAIGAVCGAVLLVFLGEKYSNWLMPLIAVYALFLGLKILVKAFRQQTKNKKIKRLGWLAAAGGFLDSFGGGGWGPIVTSSLIAKGRSPRYTIGSVNLAEFFITLSSAVTFFITVGVSHWNVVLGLLIGGGVASPLAARLAGRLPRRTMLIAVGIMIMIWCARMIIKSIASYV